MSDTCIIEVSSQAAGIVVRIPKAIASSPPPIVSIRWKASCFATREAERAAIRLASGGLKLVA